MIEFGSDFHYIAQQRRRKNTLKVLFPRANYYADGRQALIHLYRAQGWQRLWIPKYFCYDVISSLKKAGLELCFYDDYPCNRDDSKVLQNIQQKGFFRPADAVLRVNYFGTRSYRGGVAIPVVEDHTHDLIGTWAMNSHAEWCIASLRKSLPVPEGGMLWSPLGLELPEAPGVSDENERIATKRWEAMRLKAKYIAGEQVSKNSFRDVLLDTEAFYDHAEVCAIDHDSKDYLVSFDIREWYSNKRKNWEWLRDIEKDGVHVIHPEGLGDCPFSLILFFDSPFERDRVRKELIEHQVYPAILWNMPNPSEGEAFNFSKRMLSIHCDGRYTAEDTQQMKSIIESVL